MSKVKDDEPMVSLVQSDSNEVNVGMMNLLILR